MLVTATIDFKLKIFISTPFVIGEDLLIPPGRIWVDAIFYCLD
jgi:hypothetical protein